MALTREKIELSERLRSLIKARYPESNRLATLEQLSGISKDRWKNMFYGRQAASGEQIEFFTRQHPSDARWLLEGGVDPNAISVESIVSRWVMSPHISGVPASTP